MGLSKLIFSLAKLAVGSRRLVRWAARARRLELNLELADRLGNVVLYGPFAGMVLTDGSSWGDGDRTGVLLGLYEANLHRPIEEAVTRRPDVVINIGCADGIYAVGLARLLPEAEIRAFDISSRAIEACREAARLNGVERRVFVSDRCTPDVLQPLLNGRHALVLSDCEGAEAEILDPAKVPALARADLIVECHGSGATDTASILMPRFRETHKAYLVGEGPRDPHLLQELEHIGELDRWLVVHEGRPEPMKWLIARADLQGGEA